MKRFFAPTLLGAVGLSRSGDFMGKEITERASEIRMISATGMVKRQVPHEVE